MSLDRRIKKGLQSPTIKVGLALVMVVVRDDHNKFIKVHIGSGNWITVGNDRPRLAICEVPLSIPRYSQGIRGRDFRCVLVVYLFRRSCLGFIASLKGQSKTWSTHRKSVMYEVVAHPPCQVVLKMRVDEGRTSGCCVCLKGSLQSGCLWPGALWWLPDRYRKQCRENEASHQPA
jgi:hypothetical protein